MLGVVQTFNNRETGQTTRDISMKIFWIFFTILSTTLSLAQDNTQCYVGLKEVCTHYDCPEKILEIREMKVKLSTKDQEDQGFISEAAGIGVFYNTQNKMMTVMKLGIQNEAFIYENIDLPPADGEDVTPGGINGTIASRKPGMGHFHIIVPFLRCTENN